MSTTTDGSRWRLGEGDEIVPGRYALRLLGGGRRYEAYLAWDDRLHTTVVVKVVRPDRVDDDSTMDGLDAEARALRRLDHPVILRLFDAVLDGPRPHLVLEHLEGPRLSTLLRTHGALTMEQLIPLALELCAALHYLREEGFVHLDIKPSNVIMGAPPRLIDLSVACTVEQAAALREPVGTDAYMAPEQCDPAGRGPVGPPADVWGLGVTAYRAAAKRRPFTAPDDGAASPQRRWPQLVETPRPMGDRMPAAVEEPIMACLRTGPGDRPSPAELAESLAPLLHSLPKPRLGRLKPRRRRHSTSRC